MQLLTNSECQSWAAEHGFVVNPSFGHPIPSEVPARLEFDLPEDAGARVALAKALWGVSSEGVETLVWVTDWGIWPSGEHQPLIDAARRGLGAARPLIEAPGHLVSSVESDLGSSLFVLSVLFLWDCWVLPSSGRPSLFVSHDEFGLADLRHGDLGLAELLHGFNVARTSSPNAPAV